MARRRRWSVLTAGLDKIAPEAGHRWRNGADLQGSSKIDETPLRRLQSPDNQGPGEGRGARQ